LILGLMTPRLRLRAPALRTDQPGIGLDFMKRRCGALRAP
jgi:hypothetical protein